MVDMQTLHKTVLGNEVVAQSTVSSPLHALASFADGNSRLVKQS